MKKTYEGRRHSRYRWPAMGRMGRPSGFVSGSSSESSRPPHPGSTDRYASLTSLFPAQAGRFTRRFRHCHRASRHRRLIPAATLHQRYDHARHPPRYRRDRTLRAPTLRQPLEDRTPTLCALDQSPRRLNHRPAQEWGAFFRDPQVSAASCRFALPRRQTRVGGHALLRSKTVHVNPLSLPQAPPNREPPRPPFSIASFRPILPTPRRRGWPSRPGRRLHRSHRVTAPRTAPIIRLGERLRFHPGGVAGRRRGTRGGFCPPRGSV